MYLHVRKFCEWQRNALKKIVATRVSRATGGRKPRPGPPEDDDEPDSIDSIGRPVSLQSILVATQLDGSVQRLGKALRHEYPEAILLRVLQYAAAHNALSGTLEIERDAFGPCVLTRPWQTVSVKEGERVWDALVASGICVVVDAPVVSEIVTKGVEKVARVFRKSGTGVTPETHASGSGELTRVRSLSHTQSQSQSPPNPSDPNGGGALSASPLSDAERRAFAAGLRAMTNDRTITDAARAKARKLYDALSDPAHDPEDYRSFQPTIFACDRGRIAFLGARKGD